MRRRGLLAGVLLAGALGACDDPGGGADPIPIDQWDEESAAVFCRKAFECCETGELAEQLAGLGNPPPTTEAQCITAYAASLATLFANRLAAVEAGTLVYDPALAGDCFALVQDATCAQLASGEELAGGEDCDQIFDGQVANGTACTTDEECASGACIAGTSGDGTCGTLPGTGTACAGFRCAEGAWCEYDKSGMGTCRATKANGMPCFDRSECTGDACDGADPVMGLMGVCADKVPICDGV